MLSYKQIYQNLLKERDCLERHIKLLSEAKKKHYTLVCKNIANIEHPVDADFLEKVAYIKKEPVFLDNLSNFSDCFFSDEASIFLWYSSLVDFYLEGKMKKEEIEAFLDMYKTSLKEDDFSSDILYFQMVMQLVDRDLFCTFLGIKTYLFRDFFRGRFDEKVLKMIRRNLSHTDFSSFSALQQSEIKKFLSILEEKSALLKDNISLQGESTQKLLVSKISVEELQSRINEILQYVQVNRVSNIPAHVNFLDGTSMLKWYRNYLKYNKYIFLDSNMKEIQKRGFYQIVKELYNPNTVLPHEGIPLDYGSSFRRVSTLYRLNSEQLFAIFKIPGRFIEQIMKNKLVPTEEIITSILSFLQNLSIADEYQKEFVEQAISVYENLRKMHLKGDSLSFVLYSKEEENTYLEGWKNFSPFILEKVKNYKFDWYLKCLTYYYICQVKERKPMMNEYFYDGTYCYKWFDEQKRILFSSDTEQSMSLEQKAMLKVVLDIVSVIEEPRVLQDKIVLLYLDSFLDKIENSIRTYGEVRTDLTFKKWKLSQAWNAICKPLNQKEVPFTREQIDRIKRLRREIILKTKNETISSEVINFGYEISCFADSLHFTVDSLSELFSFSRSTIGHYFSNKNLPSLNHVEEMLLVIDSLDVSTYREDQVEDIAKFKKVLFSLIHYWNSKKESSVLKDSNESAVFTGKILKDIPISYLKEIWVTDKAWYEEFKKLYKSVQNTREDENLYLHSAAFSAFRRKVCGISLEEVAQSKKELSSYLLVLYQNIYLHKQEIRFMPMFLSLETFIYENKRIPRLGELSLPGNRDGKFFYERLRNSLYGSEQAYLQLPDAVKEQMKLLVQYVEYCIRERFGYPKDKVEGEKLFLGNRLNHLRIGLGFSKGAFLKRMGWNGKEIHALYRNRKSLREQHIEDLLQLFEEMKGKNLRRDQLEEIQVFIQVISTKRLEDGFTFKFCPKE